MTGETRDFNAILLAGVSSLAVGSANESLNPVPLSEIREAMGLAAKLRMAGLRGEVVRVLPSRAGLEPCGDCDCEPEDDREMLVSCHFDSALRSVCGRSLEAAVAIC
jgi:hypothetical protein